jgi:uncharacterized protein (DUF1778 family)
MTDKRTPGRPSLYGTPADTRISLRVTAAQRLVLRRVAAARGTDVAGILREMIDTQVEDRRLFADVFRLTDPRD